ncbi:Rho termination factor [Synechococcus sp. H65.1]|uniref:Rho termination factor n=1 Tax=unclassified Synechococcus TaxID=2626047 RepID=UPI0039C48BBB
MSEFSDLGKLVNLPLESIMPAEGFSAPSFLVTAAAAQLRATGGRNWVPLLVVEAGDYQYKAVGNHFVYAVAQEAGLERLWCIIVDPAPEQVEQAQVLARERIPKVNLTEASRETILAALRYLAEQPGTPLKGVDVTTAAARIAEADRSWWQDLTPITKLGCRITRGKKLDALKEVFFLAPTAPPPSKKKSSKKTTTSASVKKTSSSRSRKKKEG